jgi:deazaflavin-dependent oxidoreductase (nitroreductase family)
MPRPPAEEIFDNPADWVAGHIRRYVESNGEKGHRAYGHDSLLLTTRGRRSGKLRRTALWYPRDGDRYLLVGSNGGSNGDPAWVDNLRANPGGRDSGAWGHVRRARAHRDRGGAAGAVEARSPPRSRSMPDTQQPRREADRL